MWERPRRRARGSSLQSVGEGGIRQGDAATCVARSEPRRRSLVVSRMTDNNRLDHVWEVIERVGVCMLTTRGAQGLRARPLEARPDRAGGVIWFLTDLRSTKGDEIAAEHDVGLVFIDADEKVYLSITARGYLGQDRVKAAAIWKTSDKMWWKGPDDPNVGVLRATLLTAEMWDGPASRAVAVFEFVKSQLTGGKPKLGENRKTTIDMR